MTNQEIIDLFREIALPFKDKEGGPKLDKLQEIFANLNIESVYTEGEGLLVNNIPDPEIIIVSHMDLIKRFQKGFEEGTVFELVTEEDNDFIVGALDNTITNAVAILVLQKLLEKNKRKVSLLLSEGEEVGMIGMRNYLRARGEAAKEPFYINLDVTNEGWKKNASVEYDKPNFYILRQMKKLLKKNDVFFTNDRVCDDTDAINSADCNGFSLCLPTKGNIHSYKNKAFVNTLEEYANVLYRLCSKLKFEESCVRNISSFDFDLALKSKTFEEFTEKKEKQKSKWNQNSWNSWGGKSTPSKSTLNKDGLVQIDSKTHIDWGRSGMNQGSLFDDSDFDYGFDTDSLIGFNDTPPIDDFLGIESEDSLQQKVIDSLARMEVDNDMALTFIFEKIALNEGFSKKDLENVLGDLTEDVVTNLETESLVHKMSHDWYKFNLSY